MFAIVGTPVAKGFLYYDEKVTHSLHCCFSNLKPEMFFSFGALRSLRPAAARYMSFYSFHGTVETAGPDTSLQTTADYRLSFTNWQRVART
jgi:hypothetical protein